MERQQVQQDIHRLMRTPNMAVENADRMTRQLGRYMASMNQAWFKLWNTLLIDYAALPMRFTNAQMDFMGDALGSFEKTGQEMGGLIRRAEAQAEDTMQEAAEQVEHTLGQLTQAPVQVATSMKRASEPRRQRNRRSERRTAEEKSQTH